MKLATNIALNTEALKYILRHYVEPDVEDISHLSFMPTLRYVSACRNPDGSIIKEATVGYLLFRSQPGMLRDPVYASLPGGKRFFAIEFHEPYQVDQQYIIEYFDGAIYVINGNPKETLI
jgi:hypothetical protein